MSLTPLTQLICIMFQNADRPMLLHQNGNIIWANGEACDLFGYTRQEFMLKDVMLLASPQERIRLQAMLTRVLAHQEAPSHYQFYAMKANGDPFDVHAIACPVPLDGENNIQILIAFYEEMSPLWDFSTSVSDAIHTWSKQYLEGVADNRGKVLQAQYAKDVAALRTDVDGLCTFKRRMVKTFYAVGGAAGGAIVVAVATKLVGFMWP